MAAAINTKIREFVKQTIIEPARIRGERVILIRIGDVHRDMGLGSNRSPAVCSALQNRDFETDARVTLIYASLFPYQGSNRELVFRISN